MHCRVFVRLLLATAVGLLFAPVPAAAQEATIQGSVTLAGTGEPLSGVQVFVVGTDINTVTGENGRYILRGVPAGTVTVQALRIGFQESENRITVEAGGTATVDFELTEEAIQLPSVVAVGYGERSRRDVSASVSSVPSDRLTDMPIADVGGALQGNASGVNVVQNAGNPGGAVTVRVRGSSSISAGNQPLWVIDGVPMLQDDFSQLGMGGQNLSGVSGISPNEIESIDILKDAAATAIYGSRGSNGVIMIQTKRGRPGASRLTFDVYTGVQDAPTRLDLLNATEYLEFFNESATNDGLRENLYGTIGEHDQVSTDWQNEVLRTAPVHSVSLGVGGGDQRFTYNVLGNYYDQSGIVIGSGYERLNARANLDINVSQRLSLNGSLGVVRELTDRIENDGSLTGIITNAVANQPQFPVRLEDGSFQGVGRGTPPSGLRYPNAVALGTLNSAEAKTTRTLGNVEAEFQIAGPLRLTSRAGFDILTMRENQWESADVSGTYAASAGGIAKTGYTSQERFVFDNYLTYDPVFGQRHDLTLTGGATVELNDRELNFVRGEGFGNDHFTRVRNAANLISGDATESSHNLIGFFGRGNLSVADRYLFTASLRADGSSRFGPQNRWGVFPAASFAWLIGEEPFFTPSSFLSDVKLRTSYGITGNQPRGNYPYQGLFGTSNYGTEPALAPSSLENSELKWETTREFNVGLDLSLLNDRVDVIADYYIKHTDDLLLSRPITGTSGFTSVFANVGAIENRGVELMISSINIRRDEPGDFQWTTDFNISANRNKVLALSDDEPLNGGTRSVNRVEVGQPIGAFHMIRFLGVDPETGDAIYDEVEGDDDRQIVGSPHPDFSGGLTNSFSWGRFDLRGFLQFSYGAEIFNAMRLFGDSGGWYLDNHFGDVLDRWQQPGDQTDVPRASYYGTSGARVISSRFLEDGSYVRIQDVTLGYELPSSIYSVFGTEQARIYVSGNNLHTFTDYSGYNPDVNSGGASSTIGLGTDFYAYPLARSITIGVRGAW